ncbi:MAG TPA: 3-oxoacyl-[acyl-carrier-protein] reductase [Chthonomonadales bacterium]|nr:3-oxoacyl-[acyl-carrier-protein] reductase [Chthonomonadales bacterium]
MRLERKVALVTGAGRGGRGIGRSIALALAGEGADIAITDFVPENADAVAAEVQETTGRRAIAVYGNVAAPADVDRMFAQTLEAFGRVDILVNNAGITRDTLILRMSEDDWDAVVDTNLKGAFLCTRAAAKIMLKQKSGRVVNVASVMGIVGNAGQANYSAAKAGMIALTKTTAKELGSRGITANAVAPGFVQTAMTDVLSDEIRAQMLKQIPLARLGAADDVARVVLFLVSDDAAYVTGQVIQIDGGLFM